MCYSAMVQRDLNHLERSFGAVAVREQIERYFRASEADPKRYPPMRSRIFPGHYAPVIFEHAGARRIELMRYGAYPPASLTNGKAYTTFNARRDNLHSSFWSPAFMKHHGFVVLERFYEWVAVKDLLTAGVVGIKTVEAEFLRQAAERKEKILASGKKYQPTATERKDARERQIIIEFKPEDGQPMLAPVIFSFAEPSELEDDFRDVGFAIVTDEPPFEVQSAGHDRCPVVLQEEAMSRWLAPAGKSSQELIALLGERQKVCFRHDLPSAA